MSTAKETLVDWLRDAHAMENGIITMLEKQLGGLDNEPILKQRVQEHLEVTRDQKQRVGALITNLGGDVSTVKDTTAAVMTNLQGMMAVRAPDAAVKNVLGNFAVEHFEIASYRSLIAAAEQMGETQVATVCREILEQEEEMAEWLRQKIPDVTTEYLGKQVPAGG